MARPPINLPTWHSAFLAAEGAGAVNDMALEIYRKGQQRYVDPTWTGLGPRVGSSSAPYATIAEALADITDEGPDNVYTLSLSPGIHAGAFELVPWISIQGLASAKECVLTGAIIAPFMGAGLCHVQNVALPGLEEIGYVAAVDSALVFFDCELGQEGAEFILTGGGGKAEISFISCLVHGDVTIDEADVNFSHSIFNGEVSLLNCPVVADSCALPDVAQAFQIFSDALSAGIVVVLRGNYMGKQLVVNAVLADNITVYYDHASLGLNPFVSGGVLMVAETGGDFFYDNTVINSVITDDLAFQDVCNLTVANVVPGGQLLAVSMVWALPDTNDAFIWRVIGDVSSPEFSYVFSHENKDPDDVHSWSYEFPYNLDNNSVNLTLQARVETGGNNANVAEANIIMERKGLTLSPLLDPVMHFNEKSIQYTGAGVPGDSVTGWKNQGFGGALFDLTVAARGEFLQLDSYLDRPVVSNTLNGVLRTLNKSPLVDNYTVFIVFKPVGFNAGIASNVLLSPFDDSAGEVTITHDTANEAFQSTTPALSQPVGSDNLYNPKIISISNSTVDGIRRFQQSDADDITSPSLTAAAEGLTLFSDALADPSSYVIGWVAEVMVYDIALDQGLFDYITSYLEGKWAIKDASAPVIGAQPVRFEANEPTAGGMFITASGVLLSYLWQWSAAGSVWQSASEVLFNASGFLTDTLTFSSTRIEDTGFLRCRVRAFNDDPNFETVSDSVAMAVNVTLPVISVHQNDINVNEPNAGAVSIVASHVVGRPLFYEWHWSADGVDNWTVASSALTDVIGHATDSMTVGQAILEESGYLRCRVRAYTNTSDLARSLSDVSVFAIAGVLPVITLQPLPLTLVEPLAGEFITAASHVASGHPDFPALAYFWQWSPVGTGGWVDANTLPGISDSTLPVLALVNSRENDTGFIRCSAAAHGNFQTISSVVALTVTRAPPIIDIQPLDKEIDEGNGTVFFIVASHLGNATLFYLWEHSLNGSSGWGNAELRLSDASGQNTDTLTLGSSAAVDAGFLRCTAWAYIGGSGPSVISNNAQLAINSGIEAVGGVITDIGEYRYHTFNADGTFSVVSGTGFIDYLVVGGGGGGGAGRGGGGGGGGYLERTNVEVSQQAFPVIVGIGGDDSSGGISSFNTLVADGGGKGGSGGNSGVPGASGGGGGNGFSTSYLGGAGTPPQGERGGRSNGNASNGYSGGGGGASQIGGDGLAASPYRGGDGGRGKTWFDAVARAGGGGGHCTYSPGIEGKGADGGGDGGKVSALGQPGQPNRGGGGGGGGGSINVGGALGGSGVVVIRYLRP